MHTKATIASATKDIPLNKLKPSPANVRRTGTRSGSRSSLRASRHTGSSSRSSSSQSGTARAKRRAGISLPPASVGGRRSGSSPSRRIKRNEPIPCLIKADGIATEISLAENVIRTSMHPADQFEAFQKLIDDGGLGIEEIAARFSVTPAVVKQRLKLAAVSPALMSRYREGELTLDHMAFTLTDDHGRQEGSGRSSHGTRARR